jgi:hypothetical protein
VTEQQPIRIADHPRAMRQIELARGWGGIGCFLFVGLVSLQSNVPPLDAGVRALLAGVVGYVAGWGLSIMVWRHLALAEAAAARDSAEARRAALIEQIETRAAAMAAGGPAPGGAGAPPMPAPAAPPLPTNPAAAARAPEEAIAR